MATQVGLGLLVVLGRSPMRAALYTTREGNDTRRRNRAAVINHLSKIATLLARIHVWGVRIVASHQVLLSCIY